MNSWWETPLHSKFIEGIGDVIDDGNIALIYTPLHIPESFLSQLKITLSKEVHVSFEKINLLECDVEKNKPIESLLFSNFELDTNSEEFIPKTAAAIFDKISLDENDVIVFENLSTSLLLKFKDFIIDTGRYLSRKTIDDRQKIIVILNPIDIKENDFSNESGMEKISFQGFFDKLDYSLGLRYFHNYTESLLYENIIASISSFDIRLIDELVECNNLIEDYPKILLDYAEDNLWQNIKFIELDKLTDEDFWERWAKGITEIKNDKKVYHSAFLKIHNKDLELSKRVWVSGIEVLMPLLEDIRIKVLKCENIDFPVCFFDNRDGDYYGDIYDKMELEISGLKYHIDKNNIKLKRFSFLEKKFLKEQINICWRIRNDLSHLRMPTKSDIILFLENYDKIIELLRN